MLKAKLGTPSARLIHTYFTIICVKSNSLTERKRVFNQNLRFIYKRKSSFSAHIKTPRRVKIQAGCSGRFRKARKEPQGARVEGTLFRFRNRHMSNGRWTVCRPPAAVYIRCPVGGFNSFSQSFHLIIHIITFLYITLLHMVCQHIDCLVILYPLLFY